MNEDFLDCHDDRCVLMAEDFLDTPPGAPAGSPDAAPEAPSGNTPASIGPENTVKFSQVLADIAKVYPSAVMTGAVAAAKYVRNPVSPRETADVDILLGEKDFAEFLVDEIPADTLEKLETYFEDSDSTQHSLRHKATGVYVDFLSTETQPIRKSLVRHILQNRDAATHMYQDKQFGLDILKPEYLLAMKLIRYSNTDKQDKRMSDRLDIINILKTLHHRNITLDHELLHKFLKDREIKNFNRIAAEASRDNAA